MSDEASEPVPQKMFWMGRDVETLSRDELVEVIRLLAHDLDSAREATKSIIEIHELARRARHSL